MSLVINHNLMAENTARNLNNHYGSLSTSVERLSSGLRINSAADDAAGLAIRELMRADIATFNQGIRNANDAVSMIQTADGALQTIDEGLIRMKELAEQAATGTYDSTQRLMIDAEYQQVASEITRIALATDFNGIKLLDGSLSNNGLSTEGNVDDIIFTPGGTGVGSFGNLPEAADEINIYLQTYWRLSTETNPNVGDRNALIDSYNSTMTALRNVGVYSDSLGQPALLNHVTAPDSLVTAQSGQAADSLAMPTVTAEMLALALGDPNAPDAGFKAGNMKDVIWRITGKLDMITYTPPGAPASATIGDNTVLEVQEKIGALYSKAVDSSGNTSLADRQQAISAYNATIDSLRGVNILQDAVGNSAKLNTITSATDIGSIAPGQIADTITRPFILPDDIFNAMSSPPTEAEVIAMNAAFENIPDVRSSGEKPQNISENKIIIHFGPGNDSSEDYYAITMGNATASALGVGNQAWHVDALGNKITSDGHDISTQANAQNALDAVSNAIITKDNIRAHLGAMQNRLEATIGNLAIQAENLQASESRISDTDVGIEMTNLVRNQILTQSAVAMLSQANALPKMAQQLIGG